MRRQHWLLAVLFIPLLTGTPVQAALLWNFTYTGVDIAVTASGNLITEPLSGNYYLITGITGTRNGVPIDGLIAPGGFANNDNKLLAVPPATVQLDSFGFSYLVGGVSYNVFNVNGGPNCGTSFEYAETPADECSSAQEILFNATFERDILEPATFALLATGLLGLAVVRRRRMVIVAVAEKLLFIPIVSCISRRRSATYPCSPMA